MKKILFMALMLVAVGGISYGQTTTPAKKSTTSEKHKKEVTKNETKTNNSVSALTKPSTPKSPAAGTKKATAKKSKPAATTPAAIEQGKAVSSTAKNRKTQPAKKHAK